MTAPRLEIDLEKIYHNGRTLVERLANRGIAVTGVTKATLGSPEVASAMLRAGVSGLGDSRIENLEAMRRGRARVPMTLIRSPMLSQVDRVVTCADVSFNTEIDVISQLSSAAEEAKRTHGIVLMVELGDLREGIMRGDLENTVRETLRLPNVVLRGIGTNLACRSGVSPDARNMSELSALADSIEAAFDLTLDIVSGGNSANLQWALSGADTGRINDLRLGESILLGREPLHRRQIDGLYTDAVTLVAEVIESKVKPSQPWGETAETAFGEAAPATDRGPVLRAAQSEFHSIDELATYLETLLDERTEFDGVPVRPYERSVVRVMNLHKAKGLEAPIVFLADPTGRWDPPVTLHIDRVGDNVKGYMVVYESLFGWSPPVLAKPRDWDAYGAEEKRFEDAEDTRMLYVAATRAGAQLTVVQHEDTKANNRNYWKFFQPYLADAVPLNDPGPQHLAVEQHTRIGADDVRRSIDGIKTRWDSACEPTYGTVAAKEIAISAAGLHRPPTAGEHGTEWGTVIHFLLETAMRQPSADLRDLAYAALEEQGLELARVDEVIGTVNSVVQSDVWRRAQESEKVLVEVPFQRCISADQSVPTILRGVIDLVFWETAGWVVVDYKTDAAAATARDRLVDHYRGQVELYAKEWEAIINQPVSEKAIFFTATSEYVPL